MKQITSKFSGLKEQTFIISQFLLVWNSGVSQLDGHVWLRISHVVNWAQGIGRGYSSSEGSNGTVGSTSKMAVGKVIPHTVIQESVQGRRCSAFCDLVSKAIY